MDQGSEGLVIGYLQGCNIEVYRGQTGVAVGSDPRIVSEAF